MLLLVLFLAFLMLLVLLGLAFFPVRVSLRALLLLFLSPAQLFQPGHFLLLLLSKEESERVFEFQPAQVRSENGFEQKPNPILVEPYSSSFRNHWSGLVGFVLGFGLGWVGCWCVVAPST